MRDDLVERLFIGNTYVYRGPYPRRSEDRGSRIANGDLPVEKVLRAGGEEPSPVAKQITGTGLDAGPEASSTKHQVPNEERGGDTV